MCAVKSNDDPFSCESRDKHELELDFKRYWEEFRSSSSEKVLACLLVLLLLLYVPSFQPYLNTNHSLMAFLSSMQEKEVALNLTVDVFCRLVKQHTNVAQLLTMYAQSSSLSNLHSAFFYVIL
jgi:hypothetical protein